MATKGTVKLRRIRRMMEDCAPGWSEERKKHRIWFRYDGMKFHLPKGAHDSKGEVEIGWVQAMVNHFGISECAHGHIEMIKVRKG